MDKKLQIAMKAPFVDIIKKVWNINGAEYTLICGHKVIVPADVAPKYKGYHCLECGEKNV